MRRIRWLRVGLLLLGALIACGGVACSLLAPDFSPAADSPALVADNAGTPPADGFFNTEARFVGAVGSSNWLEGWTAFPEN